MNHRLRDVIGKGWRDVKHTVELKAFNIITLLNVEYK